MKHILILFSLIGLFASIFSSCKKSSGGSNYSANTQYLTTGSWTIRKYEEKINSSGTYVDQFASVPACTQDDQYIFSVDSTYELTEGPTKCNSSDPDVVYIGTWNLTQNETKLRIDNVTYTVNKLSSDSLIILNTTVMTPDTTYDRITLSH